jgi:hypothetical protein
MENKRILFYFENIFTVRLGERLFSLYQKEKDNFHFLRAFGALISNLILKGIKKRKTNKIHQGQYKHIFFIQTINQRNAVSSFILKLKKSDVLLSFYEELNNTSLEFTGQPDHFHLPLLKIYFKAILNLPRAYILSSVLRKKYKQKINGSHIVVNLALFQAATEVFRGYIKALKIKSATIVNDHSVFPLAWVYASRKEGIPSIYIQHASVSGVFPRLVVHTALLEGQHSLDTYNAIGNFSRDQRLVGIIRMDGLIGHKGGTLKKTEMVVGVCLKGWYPETLLTELVDQIKHTHGVSQIILRPHPGSSLAYLKSLERYALPISNAKIEKPIAFLRGLDVLVSGESTIILEAALMKIPTVYIDDTVAEFDLYGYVRHNITFHAKKISDMPAIIESFTKQKVENAFTNCKYYCDSIGTSFENKSADILVKYYNESI